MRRARCLLAVLAILAAPLTATIGQPPAAPQEPKAPAAVDLQATLGETVGMLSGLYLYQSYLNIGLLADGKAANTYDDRAARQVLASIVTPLDSVDKQFEKVAKAARTQGDRDAVEQLRGNIALLKRLGQELTAFWDSGRPEDAARYEATRQEAWKHISALLGLNKK